MNEVALFQAWKGTLQFKTDCVLPSRNVVLSDLSMCSSFLKVIVYLLCFCKRFPTNTTSLQILPLLVGPYRYPWFCKKRQGRGTEEERKRKRKGKRKMIGKKKRKGRGKEKERKRKGKGLVTGMEKDWEEKRKRIGKKRKGKEEEKKRKGKRKGSICGLVWGSFLNKWVSLRYC